MAYLALAAAPIVWGGAFVAGKILVAQTDPLAVAWVRFIMASLAFLPLEYAYRPKRKGAGAGSDSGSGPATAAPTVTESATDGLTAPPCKGSSPPRWTTYALLGLTGIFAYNLFFFYGLTFTTATESSLIIASSPVVVALIGLAFLGESLTFRKGLGILMSVVGVALVILGTAGPAGAAGHGGRLAGAAADAAYAVTSGVTGTGRLIGDLLMLGGVVSWAAYTALGKRVLRHVSSLTATARAVYWGTLFLTVPVVVRYGPLFIPRIIALVGPRELLGLLYLSLVCTVFGFVAWSRGVSATEVSRASVFLNVVPLSTLAIAVLALGERPTLVQLAGGVLVIAGVYVVSALASPRPQAAGQAR